jgi:hypothetical protein
MVRSAATSDLIYCLKLTVTDSDSGNSINTLIFPDMEYDFTFYDATYMKLYSITGLVEDVYEDQIKIKYIKNTTTTSSNNTIMDGMSNCNCVLHTPDLSRYEGPSTVFIPIANIVNIKYKWVNKNTSINDTMEVRVMLLGVSATAIKAIIIRMAFFEDCLEEAVKLVDLKAGNIYDLTYESSNGAIYESRVKVMSIEDAANNMCKPGTGYVREHVGCGNSVYTDCSCSKEEFMSAPPAKKYKIVVDTSETFTGRYETIMLDAIRDCTLVYDESNESSGETDSNVDYCYRCGHKTTNCNPNSCGHFLPPPVKHGCGCEQAMHQTYVYSYNNMYKAVISGDKVCITAEGGTTEMNLETLVKYYLGVE